MSSPLQAFLRQLGYALFEYLGDGQFALLVVPPAWLSQLWGPDIAVQQSVSLGETSSFLEGFLSEAVDFWGASQPDSLDSGAWIEKSASGVEIPLQATALRLENRPILAVFSPGPQYQERVRILQTARGSALEHEMLLREIQKKEILLHCIIHDLSQPLSVMSVALDSVSGERISPRTAEFIELGRRAGDQLQSMIREVLQAFSADLGATLDTETSANNSPDLFHVARWVAESQSPPFAAKNVRIKLALPNAPEQCRILGEESRLQRVFANLLENALRYSPAGSRVTLGAEIDDGFCKAYVDDQGPGLPRDLTPAQIFGLFSKGKQSSGKAGLGLHFCRITVERWGGTIGCVSWPEKGSRFWFRLPLAAAQDLRTRGERTVKVPASSRDPATLPRKSMRVLLADDHEDIRKLTTYQLERSGHLVTSVSNGKDALDRAQRDCFDVILLDEEMPGLTGVQVVGAIRKNSASPSSRPVLIALTGNSSSQDRDRLLAAGFDSVLGKPFHLETLTALLSDPSCIPPDASSIPLPQPGSLDDLLKRIGGDKKLLRQMIATFLRDTPKRLAAIHSALKKNDSVRLASSAHALKGSVSIFGPSPAQLHAEALQNLGRSSALRQATRLYPLLQEEIAELLEKLRGYAKQIAGKPLSASARAKSKPVAAGKPRRSPDRKRP
jgi:signal transduction histidine kinase/HPt (histidine-containing phosphotransfer) domain-containing protein/ActR/RegA family two-component response regulator